MGQKNTKVPRDLVYDAMIDDGRIVQLYIYSWEEPYRIRNDIVKFIKAHKGISRDREYHPKLKRHQIDLMFENLEDANQFKIDAKKEYPDILVFLEEKKYRTCYDIHGEIVWQS